jgi:type I restriction enzyme S subunit
VIEDLKPYPEYKDSELPWLGQVPRHWSISRIKSVLRERDLRSTDGKGILLSLTRVRGLIPHRDMTHKMHSAKTLTGYKTYRPDQIVMNRMQAWSGMFGAGNLDGLVSPDYAVFDILGGHTAKLILERLKSPDLVSQFALESKGIGSGFNRLYTDRFGSIVISLPPPEEQAAIARFLAWATNRLDRAIGAKRRIIALLQEQKQAIIHRAVTRGLDPSVPLKDSGIPWLGEIAEHWEVRRAKYLFREIDERSTHGGEELLSVSHMTGVTPRSQKNITMFKAASYAGHKLCQPGDLVINTMWAWMGALGTSTYSGIISPAYAVYRPRQMTGIIDTYIDFLLRSAPYIANIICQSTGLHASRLRLYPEAFFRLPIILPPREEQLRIVDKLKDDTADLNTAISSLEREITLLREYRTRLIADVVTGKLDVRVVAAGLPEEVEASIQADAAGVDRDEAEDDLDSDPIDTEED